MARKEDKQPQYLPLIVKAKLHTGGRDYEKIKEELKGQGFTCKQMKGMVREGNYFDGIVLYLSKWNWDNHESWHLYNWDDKDDKEVMLGIYEAEQYHPQAPYRYRDNFEKFQKDWTSGEYDPGMTFTFKDSEVEVLEVLQEEVDNIDHEAVKKQVAAAEDAKFRSTGSSAKEENRAPARAADTSANTFRRNKDGENIKKDNGKSGRHFEPWLRLRSNTRSGNRDCKRSAERKRLRVMPV